mgnify:CR=1 FL=1
MKILVDAMGGDHAPAEIVKGAVEAAKFLAGKPAGRYDMSDVISAK